MRQTSRAVALLLTLETAQAVNAPRVPTANVPIPAVNLGLSLSETVFNPGGSIASPPTNSQQLNSRTAGYTNVIPTASSVFTVLAGAKWLTAVGKLAKIGITDITTTVYSTGSGCMQCLGGGGVWCSRTYSYLSTATTSPFYQYQNTAYTGGNYATLINTGDDAMAYGAKADQGSCCETAPLFSAFIGTKSVPLVSAAIPEAGNSGTGLTMVGASCPAIKGGVFSTDKWDANAAVDDTTTLWSSWWCSNGLYKQVITGSAVILNAQQIIPQASNKRIELAQVGCPQVKSFCNNAGNSIVQALDLTTTTYSYEMALSSVASQSFSVNDKCTWVVTSALSAPTFTMMNGSTATTPTIGLVTSNWQIHNMEYTAAASFTNTQQSLQLSPSATSAGLAPTAAGLAKDSLIPMFNMPATQFSSLRTWYGVGNAAKDDVTAMSQNWMTVGQAPIANTPLISLALAPVKSQLYGNVANVPQSGEATSSSTDPLTATQNYGKANGVYFDMRAMRYFPAMVAQTVWTAGNNLSTKYSTALASYKTAKTTWDAYVAILEKNAKQDAFAALFSPPKAPTVPPLPNMPWKPLDYSGYVRATASQVAGYSASYSAPLSAASPTAQEFWTSLSAAQVSGGWGSFTATIFTFRNGWGKSFGTIGYSGDADREKMSDVWNYKWTCSTASTSTQAIDSPCESSYTATAGAMPTTLQTTTTNPNGTLMISVVSLWSTSNTDTANDSGVVIPTTYLWATNGFKLTFNGQAWKSGIVGLKPIPGYVQAESAKSLSGIAGAQALAATSAAALAVAAALY